MFCCRENEPQNVGETSGMVSSEKKKLYHF